MSIQEILVVILFMLALFFVAKSIYKSIASKNCTKGCGACSSIDFSKIDTSKFES